MRTLRGLHLKDSPPTLAINTVAVNQYLSFQLGGQTLAMGILAIREILEYVKPTHVPLVPPFIRGVMNLRGLVVPIIDLALRFTQAPTEVNRRTCIIILEVQHIERTQCIGILVDAVHEVLDIADSDIEPAPQFGSKIRMDFIAGMAKVNEEFIVLLNVNTVLSIEEMALLPELQGEHM